MNQEFISQTPLDQMVSSDYGQMLKASIPIFRQKAGRFCLSMKKPWSL